MELYLLLLESQELIDVPTSPLSITIDGKRYLLSDALDTSQRDIPPYLCVSYSWGEDRVENAVHNGSVMSNQAIPSLTAAIDNHDIHAIWMDAFCLPIDPVKKKEALQNMGYIYANAQHVVVVLPEITWKAIDEIIQVEIDTEISNIDGFPARRLEVIDADEWIRNVWTYQEVLNSKELTLIGQISRKEIELENLFSQFSRYLWTLGKAKNKTPFDIRKEYPYADALEDALLDWRISQGPSAFTVISRVFRRAYQHEEDYFYSIIGVVADNYKPTSRNTASSISDLAEMSLEICEEKGDFSFIFCSNDRDNRSGLSWRPSPGKFRPVAAWASFGVSQRGSHIPGGVVLEDMYLLSKQTEPSQMDSSTRSTLSGFLHLAEEQPSDEQLGTSLLESLRDMDYTGSSDYLLCKEGLFFPQRDFPAGANADIWVSTTIRWVFGSPGIAIVANGSAGGYEFIPGVFAGASADLGSGTEVQLFG